MTLLDPRPEGVDAPAASTFEEIVARRLSRRGLFRVGMVLGAGAAVAGAAPSIANAVPRPGVNRPFALDFTPMVPPAPVEFDEPAIADAFTHDVIISWGDPLANGLPPFDVDAQTGAGQEQRFGFNADYTAYFQLQPRRLPVRQHGLLWVNHEYTDGAMMFRGYDDANPTAEQVAVEWAAHGGTLVEIKADGQGRWRPRLGRYNRRVTATTPITITGPAAGNAKLVTAADPTGTLVLGMLNNCGGGTTPWGTLLTCEENFDQYFANGAAETDPTQLASNDRFGLPGGESGRKWERFDPRFDVAQEPHEPNRFGWVVEIDPYDPNSVPRKRTALGRFKHEAAAGITAKDGRYAVYSGDDSRFEFIYKFVTRDAVRPGGAAANVDLLDSGTLFVATFADDGTGQWLPLEYGEGPLTEANGFASQGDVLIFAREAATLLGATAMDRPEDIEPNPVHGGVYVALTNNNQRGSAGRPGPDGTNPRANNVAGHVLEILEYDNDAAATSFRWEILLLAGDPTDPSTSYGGFPADQVSMLACPDNLAVDKQGQLWIATDGAPAVLPMNDAVVGVPVTGPERGKTRQLFGAVKGSELTGVFFDATDSTMFVAVQHPGEGGTVDAPTSRWPEGGVVARSSVVGIRRIR